MTSSSTETSARTIGAQRAHGEARDRAAARALAQRPPARYEPYLDGLFTYCLSVLCDHDTATAALSDVLSLAERRGQRGPEAAGDLRAWLYALARWACLRKLAEAKQKRQTTHAAGRQAAGKPPVAEPPLPEEVQERRRGELALLAWPEAAGTTPEQREALELSVRHHLTGPEVAAVLGMEPAAARELLASAACEVERTRAALAVAETGGCPGVARLTGDSQFVLSAIVRRELVRHVDDCPHCRRTAERAVPGRWPGATVTPAGLPVLEAPRAELHAAVAHHPRARGAAVPRFDRRGFPMDPKDRAARRDRLRARAVTTTVVATVVAAPVLALWAAYRGTPAGADPDGPTATAGEARSPGSLGGDPVGDYENAGTVADPGNVDARPGPRFTKDGSPDVSVEVVSISGTGDGTGHGAGKKRAGELAVAARNVGDITLVTLTASGPSQVHWSASTTADWLYLSRRSGTLRPGESLTIKVYVDRLREPSGYWRARLAVSPAGAAVSIAGYGPAPTHPSDPSGPPPPSSSGPDPTPTTSAPADPPPSTPPGSPTPTPTEPSPSDPGTSAPPTDSGEPSPSGG
ncbi:hypothetical protein [Streptomyces sp. NPDC046805]|uniref:BACON domain-containing protein n=1 Tax=Streptomyces sp. NPDC046805 TaxID=3155134 RepID=UPI0033EDA7AE